MSGNAGTPYTTEQLLEKMRINRDEVVEEIKKLQKALQDQKMRMQDGHKNGYESETIFWTRCIWEIDQALERTETT